jgi:aminopeptidase N
MLDSVPHRACWVIVLAVVCGAIGLAQMDAARLGKQALGNPRARTASGAADDMRSYDVVSYDLQINLAMVTEDLSGRNRITLVLLLPVDHVSLHAAKLTLDSVRVDGVLRVPSIDTTATAFSVGLGRVHHAGDTVRIDVAYHRDPFLSRPSGRWGYYYFTEAVGVPAKLGYTMSEPSDARFWMPCKDEPWDKAPADITVTLPVGYVPASNGTLVDVVDHGNGTKSWHWREKHNIAPYLMSVTASRFAVSTLPFVRATGDTVPLQYYTWTSDSLECVQYLPTVRDMVASLSRLFGPYPFDKYGMTAVVPFSYGGMEHQTITTLNQYLKTDESVVVHELAHQWWGDLVTCVSWPDIWLNESFATYAEALWKESQGGFPALKSYMKNDLEHFNVGSWEGAVYDPEGQGYGLFYDVVYSKGAWVLHTLRGVIGDSAFFEMLRIYRSRYAGAAAATSDLQAVAGSVTGQDMQWFFHDWVYSPGWPIYAVSMDRNAPIARFTIYQLQSAKWPTYRMPLRVRFYNGLLDTTVVVWDSLRTQTFEARLRWVPDSLRIDPDDWVLKQRGKPPVQVVPVPMSYQLRQNYPNPFNGDTRISFELDDWSMVTLRVYDLLGREVTTLVDEWKTPGEYFVSFDTNTSVRGTGRPLASGVYFYRLVAGNRSDLKKMVLIK